MILTMNKYAFMVFHKDYADFLDRIRQLGVVHIREIRPAIEDAALQTIMAERKRINVMMRFLANINKNASAPVQLNPARRITEEEGLRWLASLEALQEQKAKLLAKSAAEEKDLDYLSVWGDFTYPNIRNLLKAGYEVSFFTCPTARFEPQWGVDYNAFLVNNFQSVSYFVTVTKIGTPIDIDAERARMPEHDAPELRDIHAKTLADIRAIDDRLAREAADVNTLDALDRLLQDKYDLKNAYVQTEHVADDRLMLLEGWLPENDSPQLEKSLDADGFYYLKLDIAPDDNVPIQLRNDKFSRLYEPITKMFSLPNYSELDPTPLFAPFFMLFFGLCFGDGGYGLLIIIACAYLKRKMSADYKDYLSLFQWLGLAAVIVGTCTGSFFGVALASVPALERVKSYFVSSDNLMTFSIIIGLVQIIFGKAVAAYKTKMQKGFKYSIAPFAWVFVILALALALGLPVLNVSIPPLMANICFGIAAVGLLIAFFYNSPGKNPFLNFGTGLWNTYNMASGLLGDTLSYIRLFAIGLTGSILGGVFNTLAITMTDGMNIVLRIVVMALILLAGHAINFGLCTISSLVHPLRLIFVEYYKNSEFEGGGKQYAPLKQHSNN